MGMIKTKIKLEIYFEGSETMTESEKEELIEQIIQEGSDSCSVNTEMEIINLK